MHLVLINGMRINSYLQQCFDEKNIISFFMNDTGKCKEYKNQLYNYGLC